MTCTLRQISTNKRNPRQNHKAGRYVQLVAHHVVSYPRWRVLAIWSTGLTCMVTHDDLGGEGTDLPRLVARSRCWRGRTGAGPSPAVWT